MLDAKIRNSQPARRQTTSSDRLVHVLQSLYVETLLGAYLGQIGHDGVDRRIPTSSMGAMEVGVEGSRVGEEWKNVSDLVRDDSDRKLSTNRFAPRMKLRHSMDACEQRSNGKLLLPSRAFDGDGWFL